MGLMTRDRASIVCSGPALPAAALGAGPGDSAGALESLSTFSALISRHIFQEGEIIELVVRPSAWRVLFSSWRTLLLCAAIILAGITFAPGRSEWYIELGLMGGLVRLMWATVKWMSRIHVLTNLRVMTVSGVFNVEVTECPLRRMAQARLLRPLNERLLLLGTLELTPRDESFPVICWQTIRKPDEIHRKVQAAITRARQ